MSAIWTMICVGQASCCNVATCILQGQGLQSHILEQMRKRQEEVKRRAEAAAKAAAARGGRRSEDSDDEEERGQGAGVHMGPAKPGARTAAQAEGSDEDEDAAAAARNKRRKKPAFM